MKKLFMGIIIGLVLGMSTSAFATIGDSVTAVFAQFSYVVNGESKTLDSPVLVHDGNSYLRTTQISNMLGYDVTYKADSRTIEFDKPNPIIEPEEVVTEILPEQVENSSYTPLTNVVEPTPEPTPETSVTVEPTPEPVDNTAQCQAIRDDYAYQIVMAKYYEGGNETTRGNKVLKLEYDRDKALASAGCN